MAIPKIPFAKLILEELGEETMAHGELIAKLVREFSLDHQYEIRMALCDLIVAGSVLDRGKGVVKLSGEERKEYRKRKRRREKART